MPSPNCGVSRLKSMLRPSMRGGVPVFRRPCGNFSSFRRDDSVIAGGSPARPAAWLSSPTCTLPFRNVPAVNTTLRERKRTPTCVTTPATASPSTIRSSQAPWNSHRFGWFSSRRRIAARYRTRSAWARVARTAGPFEPFRMRNWMPASSVAAAMAPPSASISFTRWPLPMPPMDGLQLICPSVSMLCVSSKVAQPTRADASAASVPAWPPPITMTSKTWGNHMVLPVF